MKLTLRSLITIPLIAQIVGVTAVTGWLAHRNGQAAVEAVAYQLLNETGEHLQHKLDIYTSVPRLVTQANKDALALQQLDPENLASWFPHLFRQIQRFPDITYIYYGHADGRYVELNRLPDGSLEFAIKNSASELVQISPVTEDGRLQATGPKSPYDPRQRPWYRVATDNLQPRWTGVYDFEDPSPTLGISFVHPHLGADNKFQGVLGADFTLDAIESFIKRVQTRHSSAMFLMDTDGKILASSAGEPPFSSQTTPIAGEQERQQILVQQAAEHVLSRLETRELQKNAQQFSFRSQHNNYWVQITPFADNYGLSWLGVSLLSEANFTGQIRANSRNTLLLSLLAMLISSGVSFIIARWIQRPIQQLGEATQSLRNQAVPQYILPSSIQELNLLVENFNHMAKELETSRSQLNTYSQKLEELVDQRTAALRRSEETFSKAFQASPNAITLSTLDEGRYIKVNDRFVELMGIPREQIIGRTSIELNVWIEPRTRSVFQRELKNGTLRNQEWPFRKPSGEIKTVLLSAEIIYFQDKACVLVIANDIGERIAAQEKLRQSEATIREQEQFLRSIYNGVEAGIFVIDVIGHRQFRYIDSNLAVERMSGARRQVLINATPEELFPPETAVELVNKYQHCVDQGKVLSFEEELFINNKWNWWLTTLTPLHDHQKQIYRLIGTTLNITQRKTVEGELAQQVQRARLLASINNQVRQSLEPQQTYQTTVDQIGDAFGASRCCLHVYTETPTSRLTTAAEYLVPEYGSRWDIPIPLDNNPHIQAVLAQDQALVTDDVTRAPLLEAVMPLWGPLSIKSMLAIRTSYQGKPNGVIEVHQCNRQRPWLPWEVELLESVADQVGIAIAQARLLAQAQVQQEKLTRQNIDLKTAKQQAEKASQVKGEFLANMSHELRTPLNAILGFAQIMQRAQKHDPIRFQQDAAKHLQVIQTSGDHLLNLINEVLDMAKIEAGQISINRHPFDLHTLVRSLQTMFQPKAHDKGLQLKCECGIEVSQYIETDEAKLRQILINLLGNAIKFTNHGSVLLKIHGEQPLHIEVKDTGQGIAPKQLEHIFEAFYQTDTGLQAQSGTGLGLAISKTYAELLGGTLSAESVLGKGSIFRCQLPVTLANRLDNDHQPQPPVIRLAPNQPRYRILVVEDKWTSRTLLVKLLAPVGFDVREAANGKEALQIWQEWHPHLIWMDMRMPVMDGYEATQRIRSSTQGQATAIIALTASALESEKQMILSIGCDDFVRKPFYDQIIFSKLEEHLGAQYVYESQISGPSTSPLDNQHKRIAAELCKQPQEWLSQLQAASSLADAEWVSQLIDELPPTEIELANALRKLAQGFRCDLIAELSSASLESQPS